jgi:hypothetical protein
MKKIIAGILLLCCACHAGDLIQEKDVLYRFRVSSIFKSTPEYDEWIASCSKEGLKCYLAEFSYKMPNKTGLLQIDAVGNIILNGKIIGADKKLAEAIFVLIPDNAKLRHGAMSSVVRIHGDALAGDLDAKPVIAAREKRLKEISERIPKEASHDRK